MAGGRASATPIRAGKGRSPASTSSVTHFGVKRVGAGRARCSRSRTPPNFRRGGEEVEAGRRDLLGPASPAARASRGAAPLGPPICVPPRLRARHPAAPKAVLAALLEQGSASSSHGRRRALNRWPFRVTVGDRGGREQASSSRRSARVLGGTCREIGRRSLEKNSLSFSQPRVSGVTLGERGNWVTRRLDGPADGRRGLLVQAG